MAWEKSPRSIQYDDEEMYDRAKAMMSIGGPEPSEYPSGCMMCLTKADLESAGAEGGKIGDELKFSAMGEVTSVFEGKDDCRIELEVTRFAGPDGKFFDLSQPCHICLCGPELEKIDLDADAERGDTIHLIGTARLESRSSTEYGGDSASLQIVALNYEDESAESREG